MKRLTATLYLLVILGSVCCRSAPSAVEITEIHYGGITDAHVDGTYTNDDPPNMRVVEK